MPAEPVGDCSTNRTPASVTLVLTRDRKNRIYRTCFVLLAGLRGRPHLQEIGHSAHDCCNNSQLQSESSLNYLAATCATVQCRTPSERRTVERTDAA